MYYTAVYAGNDRSPPPENYRMPGESNSGDKLLCLKALDNGYAPEDKNVQCTSVDLACAASAKVFEPYGC